MQHFYQQADQQLEWKEPTRRGRPSKEQKQSGLSHQEEDLSTRRRDGSYSNCEGEGKAKNGKRSGSRNGNIKEKMDVIENPLSQSCQDQEARKASFPAKTQSHAMPQRLNQLCEALSLLKDGQRTCSGVGLTYDKLAIYKKRGDSSKRYRRPHQIKCGESGEGAEKRNISKLSKQRASVFDLRPTPVLEFA